MVNYTTHLAKVLHKNMQSFFQLRYDHPAATNT